MAEIAPLHYERNLALVGPVLASAAEHTGEFPSRHVEQLVQISAEINDRWHEFSAQGEVERQKIAREGKRGPIEPVPAQPLISLSTVAGTPWVTVAAQTTTNMNEMWNGPSAKEVAGLYNHQNQTPPPTLTETG